MTRILSLIGAGLLCCLLSATAAAQECPISALKIECGKTKITADTAQGYAKTCADKFEALAQGKTDTCREALFLNFRSLYFDAMSKASEWKELQKITPDKVGNKKEIETKIAEVGWMLRSSEGDFYVTDDSGWMNKRFSQILPKAWRSYFTISAAHTKEPFSNDASLLVSWDNVQKRIATWEEFLALHPKFVQRTEIQALIDIYLSTLLTGMDNSRITPDVEGKKPISDDVRKAYESFLAKKRDWKSYKIVSGYYDVLKAEGFRVTRKAHTFLKQNKVSSMLGVQPPF